MIKICLFSCLGFCSLASLAGLKAGLKAGRLWHLPSLHHCEASLGRAQGWPLYSLSSLGRPQGRLRRAPAQPPTLPGRPRPGPRLASLRTALLRRFQASLGPGLGPGKAGLPVRVKINTSTVSFWGTYLRGLLPNGSPTKAARFSLSYTIVDLGKLAPTSESLP